MTVRDEFASQRALDTLEKIEKALHERGGASTWDIALLTGLSQNRAGEFLRYMKQIGTAVCTKRACAYQGGTTGAQWGPGTASLDIVDECDARVVVVRQQWKSNLKRDPLDCYLFGVPEVRAAA